MSSPEPYGQGEFASRGSDQPSSLSMFNGFHDRLPFQTPAFGMPLVETPRLETPLFEAAGWSDLDGHSWDSIADDRQADVSYINAGTCPDCGSGMIRLGHCMSCPCCGYGSCGE